MKFGIGSVVKVKDDLIVGNVYGDDTFIELMNKYKGITAKVVKVLYPYDKYQLEGCETWGFTDEMLEPAEIKKFTKEDLQTGDIVELRCGDLFVFVNKQLGFVSICQDSILSGEDEEDNTASYLFIDNDFSHCNKVKDFDVIKVYRYNNEEIITSIFPESMVDYDIIWQRES